MINVPVRVRSPPFPANFYEKINLPSCLPRLLLTGFAHLSRVKIKFSLRARFRSGLSWTLFALVDEGKKLESQKSKNRKVRNMRSIDLDTA